MRCIRSPKLGLVCAAGVWLAAAEARAADPLTIQSVVLDRPTLHVLGVQVLIADDDDHDARVDVRYRTGGGAFREAPPLFRVRPETLTGYTVPAQFAGSVFDLAPDTEYEIELHFVDPDGVDETRSVTARTRPIPSDPASPRAVAAASAAELRTALGNAQPGDVITIADGTYTGSFSLGASGTAERPIVIRGQTLEGVVLDGQGCTDCNVIDVGGSFVHVERMTLRNAVRGLAFGSGATEGGVARWLRITDVVHGIAAQAAAYTDLVICDNVIEGRLRWPWVFDANATDHWDDRGISIRGNGHVICHNHITGFGDPITQREQGARAFDYYGNDIDASYDGSEVDGAEGNARVWGNRWTNVQAPLSVQPILGGPAYLLRNVLFNITDEQIKFKMTGSEPSGLLAYHNTWVGAQTALNLQTPITGHNFVISNNLFIGPAQPAGATVEWTAGVDGGLFDYNGYFPDGRFWLGVVNGQNVNGASFVELQARGVFETHGVLLAAPIFAFGLQAPPDMREHLPPPASFALATGSNAIDRGVALPGINASHRGAAPDLGAWEAGCPEPHYGPRAENDSSFTPVDGCGSGGTGGGGSAGSSGAGGGAGATGGAAGSGGAAGGAGGSSGAGGVSGAGASGPGGSMGSAGFPGATPGSADDNGGCGCRLSAGSTRATWAALLFAFVALHTRRRNAPRYARDSSLRAERPRARDVGTLGRGGAAAKRDPAARRREPRTAGREAPYGAGEQPRGWTL